MLITRCALMKLQGLVLVCSICVSFADEDQTKIFGICFVWFVTCLL